MTVADFNRCIEYEDTTTLSKIPGIGRKTADRLIIEMRDRVDTLARQGSAGVSPEQGARSEAVEALVALGYKPAEVTKLVARLDVEGMTAEDIIRLALRQAAG